MRGSEQAIHSVQLALRLKQVPAENGGVGRNWRDGQWELRPGGPLVQPQLLRALLHFKLFFVDGQLRLVVGG